MLNVTKLLGANATTALTDMKDVLELDAKVAYSVNVRTGCLSRIHGVIFIYKQ